MKTLENRILSKNRSGYKALGANFAFPSIETVELIGMLGGFDYIYIDGEHGAFTSETIDSICRVANGLELTVIARVPDIRPSTVIKFLDRGVMGILGPHIETREQAQALVDACLFYPEGNRSWGGGRGTFYNNSDLLNAPDSGRTEFMTKANQEMFIMAQLETITAFKNLNEILQVEGIDGFSWGPNDLAQSMGQPGKPDHPDVLAAQVEVSKRIKEAGRSMSYDKLHEIRIHNLIVEGVKDFLVNNKELLRTDTD